MSRIQYLTDEIDDTVSPKLLRTLEEFHGLRNGPKCDGLCDILETEINEPLPPAAPPVHWRAAGTKEYR